MRTERGVLAYPKGDLMIQLASEERDPYRLEDLESFAYTPEFDMFLSGTEESTNAIAVWSQRRMARKSGCECHGKYVEVRTLNEDRLEEWIESGVGFEGKEPPLTLYNGFFKPEGMEILLPLVYNTDMPCNKIDGDLTSRTFRLYRSLENCQFWLNCEDYLQGLSTSVIVLAHVEGDIAYEVLHPAVAQQTGKYLNKIDEKGHNQMNFFDQTTIEVPYRVCSDKCAPKVLSDILAHQLRSQSLFNMISGLVVHTCSEEEPEEPTTEDPDTL